jgi:hypothetical protein
MLVILTGSGVRMGLGQQVARRTCLHAALLQVLPLMAVVTPDLPVHVDRRDAVLGTRCR